MAATLALAALAASSAAWAVSQVPGPIEIGPSWGQADAAKGTVSLYTTIINRGVLADRLAGGTCARFGAVHLAGLDRAIQGSQPPEQGVFLPPGSRRVLEPDGAHLTVSDSNAPVEDGALVPCTLSFVHSGQRIVIFRIGAAGPAVQEP